MQWLCILSENDNTLLLNATQPRVSGGMSGLRYTINEQTGIGRLYLSDKIITLFNDSVRIAH
jgi:hypothetical protein